MSEPAHRLLDDLDVRSQYVQPRPPVFFNSISGPLLDNLIWRNILRRGLWLWTLYHCNLCNLNVALNKMMMMMLMLIMITWIHYVSKKYRRQAEGKSHSIYSCFSLRPSPLISPYLYFFALLSNPMRSISPPISWGLSPSKLHLLLKEKLFF